MKLQFTTPCYVRIKDADKRKEVCEQLKRIGYGLGQFYIDMLDNMIITYPKIGNTFCTGMTGQFDKIDLKGCIDCGDNTDLFLALAGMNLYAEKGQWYVFLYSGELYKNIQTNSWPVPEAQGLRRATAQEIVEHFNNKTK